jgi:hypothetical protein
LAETGLRRGGDVDGAAGEAGAAGAGGSAISDGSFGGSGASDSGLSSDADAAALLPYAYRRRIAIKPGPSGIVAGASVSLTFDHQALASLGHALASGNDVRVFFKGTGPALELDRVLDPVSLWDQPETRIWFRVQEAITGLSDMRYYLYYGDEAAGPPPADPNKVYAFFDGFDGTVLEAGWTGGQIGSATGTFTVAGGVVHIEGSTGDIWDFEDNFLFLHRPMTGNFVADARVSNSGGALHGWSKLGGVMVRASVDKWSKNRLMAPVNGSAARTSSYRATSGGATNESSQQGPKPIPEFERLERVTDSTRTWFSANGVDYAELGSSLAFEGGLPDQVLVGVPFANLAAGKGWVEIDWFRVRLWIAEEPELSLDIEEPGPFAP